MTQPPDKKIEEAYDYKFKVEVWLWKPGQGPVTRVPIEKYFSTPEEVAWWAYHFRYFVPEIKEWIASYGLENIDSYNNPLAMVRENDKWVVFSYYPYLQ